MGLHAPRLNEMVLSSADNHNQTQDTKSLCLSVNGDDLSWVRVGRRQSASPHGCRDILPGRLA